MTPHVLVSYDDTAYDQDALALARRLADAGAEIALAYVRHTPEPEQSAAHSRSESAAHELLERGASTVGFAIANRHVILNPSTADGLRELAERERTDIIVFGSDYRTPVGSVLPQKSAQRLLDGGPAAIAIAPAGLRDRDWQIKRIGVAGGPDAAASETARSLAAALGATVAESGTGPVDLLIAGSRPEAPDGRVRVSAVTEYAIETTSAPVLVVRRGTPITFGALVAH